MARETFKVKNWANEPSTTTPLSAEALKDIETRITTWVEEWNEAGHWRAPVASKTALLALTGNIKGDTRLIEETPGTTWYYTGAEWVEASRFIGPSSAKILFGNIKANGSIETGSSSGYTIKKEPAGEYQINYTTEWTNEPTVTVTARGGVTTEAFQALVSSNSKTQTIVKTIKTSSQASEEKAWFFLAIGK